MAATAPNAVAGRRITEYEQPLSERMRTFLRLEFLYRQMLYNVDDDSDWATRAVIATLLEIMAILVRGDIRSDAYKELDTQISHLERYKSQPQFDGKRLDTLIGNLAASRKEIDAAGTNFLQPLKDCQSPFLDWVGRGPADLSQKNKQGHRESAEEGRRAKLRRPQESARI